MRVAVLGGGITGTSTTQFLLGAGHAVNCFEAAPVAGGLCRSETLDGFVVDRAGGHILFSKDQEVLNYLLSVLGSNGYHTSRRETYIYLKGRYVQYPFENGLGDLDKADTFACLRDYLEAHHARRIGVPAPSNFHDWCLWRFGRSICELFMHPYNRKIWNVDLRELGTEWVQGRVPDAPTDDVLRAALGIRTQGYVHQAIFHYPLTGGFESIVRGVTAKLPPDVLRLSTPVRRLERRGNNFLVDGQSFDRVVSTIPLQDLRRILLDVPPDVGRAFDALDYVSLLTVFIALRRPPKNAHSWIYFPHEADGPQNRVTHLSNYSPKNAPPGCSSLMAEVTYYRELPAPEDETVQAVVEGLERAGFLERGEILFTKTFRNRYAYILYRSGLERELETVRSYCQELGIDVVGRFGNYSYFNSDSCVRAAMDLAKSYPRGSSI